MRVNLATELTKLPGRPSPEWPAGVPFRAPFAHGSMRLVVFAPRGSDVQTPHGQDEVYIVVSGRGTLVIESEAFPFERGDALFVGAGKEHRFVDFSDDLVTWAIFWGPEGGEPAGSG
ncbi:MAG: cupin domain-containing protein [Dehalococcoidia bacterium]